MADLLKAKSEVVDGAMSDFPSAPIMTKEFNKGNELPRQWEDMPPEKINPIHEAEVGRSVTTFSHHPLFPLTL